MRVSFLVPAYNEAATIEAVLEAVDALPFDRQIVVVDDGSTDETAAIVERWGEGTGRSRSAAPAQPRQGGGDPRGDPTADGDIVVIQDADLEYDPADVPALIDPICAARPTSSSAPGSRAASRSARTCSGTSSGTTCSRC